MFDVIRQQAVDYAKQIGMAAKAIAPQSDHDKKELAKLEIKAEVDPKVYAEMSDFIEKMLDAAGKAGNLDETIAKLKDYARRQQREFEDQTELEEAMMVRQEDKLIFSPALQELQQAGPQA